MRRNRGLATWGHVDHDVVVFEDDFLRFDIDATGMADTGAAWLTTGSGTSVLDTKHGGWLLLTGQTTTDHGIQLVQLNGEAFTFTSARRLLFTIKNVQVGSITTANFHIALCPTDTAPIGADAAHGQANQAAWLFDGSVSKLYAVMCNTGATDYDYKQDTGFAVVAATSIKDLAIEWNGSDAVTWFIDGAQVARRHDPARADIPAAATTMTVSLCVQNIGSTTNTLKIDKAAVVMER